MASHGLPDTSHRCHPGPLSVGGIVANCAIVASNNWLKDDCDCISDGAKNSRQSVNTRIHLFPCFFEMVSFILLSFLIDSLRRLRYAPPLRMKAAPHMEHQTPPCLFTKLQQQNGPSSNFPIPLSEFPIPTSVFPIPTSQFRLPTSDFPIPTSDFRLPTSQFPLIFPDPVIHLLLYRLIPAVLVFQL